MSKEISDNVGEDLKKDIDTDNSGMEPSVGTYKIFGFSLSKNILILFGIIFVIIIGIIVWKLFMGKKESKKKGGKKPKKEETSDDESEKSKSSDESKENDEEEDDDDK